MRLPVVLALAAALMPMPALAALSERELAQAVARPPAGARLPALTFSDLSERPVQLGSLTHGTPLVVIFADYTCRNVCSPGLTITAVRLHETGLQPGAAYRLAVIGIDPKDSRADAMHFAQSIRNMPEVAVTTRFLRGTAANIDAATHALGYGYVYDPALEQYAHDASVYVFAADGTLTTVLPEIGLQAAPLKAALADQGAPRERGWIAQAAHLCYGFAASHGRFGRPIVVSLQVLAVLLLCVAALAFRRWRRVAR